MINAIYCRVQDWRQKDKKEKRKKEKKKKRKMENKKARIEWNKKFKLKNEYIKLRLYLQDKIFVNLPKLLIINIYQ